MSTTDMCSITLAVSGARAPTCAHGARLPSGCKTQHRGVSGGTRHGSHIRSPTMEEEWLSSHLSSEHSLPELRVDMVPDVSGRLNIAERLQQQPKQEDRRRTQCSQLNQVAKLALSATRVCFVTTGGAAVGRLIAGAAVGRLIAGMQVHLQTTQPPLNARIQHDKPGCRRSG
jgi:hypothetical protein